MYCQPLNCPIAPTRAVRTRHPVDCKAHIPFEVLLSSVSVAPIKAGKIPYMVGLSEGVAVTQPC